MGILYPEELKQDKIMETIKDVLGQQYVTIKVTEFILKEAKESSISCIFSSNSLHDDLSQIEGKGVGIVDALYNGITSKLSKKFKTLASLQFEDFSATVKFKGSKQKKGIDAPVEICLVLRNSQKKRLYFRARSRSIAMAAVKVVSKAIEYLINAELAAIELYKNIISAENRNRDDLKATYTTQLSEVVQITSYEKVIKSLDKRNY